MTTATDTDWGSYGDYGDVEIAQLDQDPWEHLDGGASAARDRLAERAVIGSMLLSAAVIDDVAKQVKPEHFTDPRLEELASVIFELHRDAEPIDLLTVMGSLRRRTRNTKIDLPFLNFLTNGITLPAAAPTHAATVRQCAKLRKLGAIGNTFLGLAKTIAVDDIPAALTRARELLEEAENDNPAEIPATAGEKLPATLDRFEKPLEKIPNRACFGISDLDNRFTGFKPGQLTLIAGRPGTGKSLLGLCIARATSMTMGNPVLIASMEMTDDEIMTRLVCAEARVDLGRVDKGALDDSDWARIAKITERIERAPLRFDDKFDMDLDYLRGLVRTLRRGPGCELLVVDYLQLIKAPRAQNREQSIAAVSRGLKGMAKDFEIPVVALCQLNRESERRTDKKPTKSDLRESGSLEQDADNVILLHRPELYGAEDKSGCIEVIIDKHRGGALFTAECTFQGHYGRIVAKADERAWSPSGALVGAP